MQVIACDFIAGESKQRVKKQLNSSAYSTDQINPLEMGFYHDWFHWKKNENECLLMNLLAWWTRVFYFFSVLYRINAKRLIFGLFM